MSARAVVSPVVYLPSAIDESFLRNTAEALTRLHAESERRGHHLLGSLLAIAKGEAEDGIRTHAKDVYVLSREQDRDDGVAMMAQKLACRSGARD